VIGWVIACAVLVAAHLVAPLWWWVALVPFAWGLTLARGPGRAALGGAALGALVWGGAAAIAWHRGADATAARVAGLLGPWTAGRPVAIAVATALVAAMVAGTAAAAGASLAPPAKARR